VPESRQRWQVLRRWRDRSLGQLPRRAVLATMAGLLAVLAVLGVVWWGLAGLAVAGGIALIGGLIVWVVVMPRRLAPPLPNEALAEIADVQVRLEMADARTRLRSDLQNGRLQILTVVAVFLGAVVGFQQLTEDRDQAIQDRQLTRQGQASERFTRAIDQLGSNRLETRIGGIYGLDQIAEQSPDNTGPVGEVLLAWVNGRPRTGSPPGIPLSEYAPDVQAALTVLTGQRYKLIVHYRLDLHGLQLRSANLGRAYLRGARLEGANLEGADLFQSLLGGANLRSADLSSAFLRLAELKGASLTGARLEDANLQRADLYHAFLFRADLRRANLEGANLEGARLLGADLEGAHLRPADLKGANLDSAHLRDADLGSTNLRGASLRGASLRGANLRGANLHGADFSGADLLGANLSGAIADKSTRWPGGFDPGQTDVIVLP
jgi:uncharacterized protein YjbI with pentapeptide repeats